MKLNGYECDRCHEHYIESIGEDELSSESACAVWEDAPQRVALKIGQSYVGSSVNDIVHNQVCPKCVAIIKRQMEPTDRTD